jgi:hypothetical protein
MKKIYLNQPRYLGDIIFVMAIAQNYVEAGFEVIFPVEDSYLKSMAFEKYFPNIKFIPLSDFSNFSNYRKLSDIKIEDEEKIVLNLINTDRFKKHMGKKYSILDFPVDMWRTVKINRNLEAEEKLLEKLGINKSEKFNLINEYYSNKKTNYMKPKTGNNYKNINLERIDGFNLIDWMGVIEKASSIHTVHTSIQYIIDIMDNITTDLHIYPRAEIYEPHAYYDYLFRKKYYYHSHPKNIKYQLSYILRKIKRSFLLSLK